MKAEPLKGKIFIYDDEEDEAIRNKTSMMYDIPNAKNGGLIEGIKLSNKLIKEHGLKIMNPTKKEIMENFYKKNGR